MTYAPINAKTAFLPTSDFYPKDESQRLAKLTANYTDIAQSVNVREIALYQNNLPVITGQQFSDPNNNQKQKFTYRNTYYFGAILAGATLNIPHNIPNLVQCTHIYGTCVTAADFRPIPYASTAAINRQISVKVFPSIPAINAFIQIVNGAGAPDIISGIIVLEYLQN